MTVRLTLSQNEAADELLSRSPLALLIGMLLDQQVPMEWAFTAPVILHERLGGLDAADIASRDPAEFATLACTTPAIHRFPGAMATRIQALCRLLVEEYGGDAGAVWADVADGKDLHRRLVALPGFGAQKAKIFAALLGKQLGVRPPGWQEAAAPYAEEGCYRSVADIVDAESIQRVRDYKQAAKKASREAADPDGADRPAADRSTESRSAKDSSAKSRAAKSRSTKDSSAKDSSTKSSSVRGRSAKGRGVSAGR